MPGAQTYVPVFEDEDFLQRYIDRWSELRTNVFATSNILARIDSLAREIEPAAIRNHQRWFPPRDATEMNREPAHRFKAEVEHMKRWIADRLGWIDSQDFAKPITVIAKGDSGDGDELRMACITGKVYYTLDGSDPRMRGGAISPKAREYQSPIPMEGGRIVTARVRSDYSLWSAPKVVRIESGLNLK